VTGGRYGGVGEWALAIAAVTALGLLDYIAGAGAWFINTVIGP